MPPRGGGAPPAGHDPPDQLDQPADRDRDAERHRESSPRRVLERPSAQAADGERVAGPDEAGDGGRDHEAAARVADDAAAQGDRRPPAGDEPAHHDELHPEPLQRPFGPGPPPRAFLAPEEAAFDLGPEAPADQVGQVVTEERAQCRTGHQQRDARIGTARGRDAQRDDHGLAGEHRNDRVQGRDDDRDDVGDNGADLQARERAHRRAGAITTGRPAGRHIEGSTASRG